eukprot:2315144-Amphidinium_carterae.1
MAHRQAMEYVDKHEHILGLACTKGPCTIFARDLPSGSRGAHGEYSNNGWPHGLHSPPTLQSPWLGPP